MAWNLDGNVEATRADKALYRFTSLRPPLKVGTGPKALTLSASNKLDLSETHIQQNQVQCR